MIYSGSMEKCHFEECQKHPWAHEIFTRMLERATQDLEVSREKQLTYVDTMSWYAMSTAWESGSRVLRLACLYRVTGEEKYARKCAEICGWIVEGEKSWNINPAHDLVYADFVIALAIATNWLEGAFPEYQEFRTRMLAFLEKIMGVLDEWYEKRFIPNNHAVVSLVPYAVMAGSFPEASKSESWWRQAETGIDECVLKGSNVGLDGDWFEGTFNYQNFLLFHLMFYFELAKIRGRDYYADAKTKAMFECLLQAVTPDRGIVNFNDNFHKDGYAQTVLTSGVVLLKGAAEFDDSALAWAAEWLRPNLDWDRMSCLFCDTASLMFIPFQKLPPAKPPTSKQPTLLRKTGYVFLRDDWEENGSLFAAATLPKIDVFFAKEIRDTVERVRKPGHAHCDAGSFEFYFRGTPITMEPGYLWCPAERIFPQYHNTLSVDGQPVPYGQWSMRPDVCGELLDYHGDENLFEMRIDLRSFLKIKSALRIITVELRKGVITWLDELSDDRDHEYSGYYHGQGSLREVDGVYHFAHPNCRSELRIDIDHPFERTTAKRPTTINYRGLNSSLLEKDVICQTASTVAVTTHAQKAIFRWKLRVFSPAN